MNVFWFFVLYFLFCCNQLCQAALMNLLIQFMSVYCVPDILKDFYNLYFKIFSLLLCHRSYLKTSNAFTWSFYGPHLQVEYSLATGRFQGDRFSSHRFPNDPEQEYPRRALDAEPGATSSSNADLSSVNAIKYLLLLKEQS